MYSKWCNGGDEINFAIELSNEDIRPVFFIIGNISNAPIFLLYSVHSIPEISTVINPVKIVYHSDIKTNVVVGVNKHNLGNSLRVRITAPPNVGSELCTIFPSGGKIVDEW